MRFTGVVIHKVQHLPSRVYGLLGQLRKTRDVWEGETAKQFFRRSLFEPLPVPMALHRDGITRLPRAGACQNRKSINFFEAFSNPRRVLPLMNASQLHVGLERSPW